MEPLDQIEITQLKIYAGNGIRIQNNVNKWWNEDTRATKRQRHAGRPRPHSHDRKHSH
eukprot:SAG31_NODE_46625_length_253_cov_1.324675_1_plen_57_part_10